MLIRDPLRAAEDSERVSSNVGISRRCSVCYVPPSLTPLQGDSFLWDALPGVKTPGLRPLAPSGRRALSTHTGGPARGTLSSHSLRNPRLDRNLGVLVAAKTPMRSGICPIGYRH